MKTNFKKRIAVIDFETDPFEHGEMIAPFSCGFYDGETYKSFWGDDCVEQLVDFLSDKKPMIIYAHNGGKFDFLFFVWKNFVENPMLVINGRIVKFTYGKHEFRDSYAAIPEALSAYKKDEIDYEIMKKNRRNYPANKTKILEYLKNDCVYLHEMISAFCERFDRKLTVGMAAINELSKLHGIIKTDKHHDRKFRPYFFGGRVSCFESGKLKGDFKVYDVNSMYPHVMKSYDHPFGKFYIEVESGANDEFDHKTGYLKRFGKLYFAEIEAENNGALPASIFSNSGTRTGITFDQKDGVFFVCSHELITAIQLNLVRVKNIRKLMIPCQRQNYATFVDRFYNEKVEAKKKGDRLSEKFSKLIMNSSYGKFSSNPALYKDWFILNTESMESQAAFRKWYDENGATNPEGSGEQLEESFSFAQLHSEIGTVQFWEVPAPKDTGYYDVAIGASITSAARSVLLRAIHNCERPVYCDTDSLICESLFEKIDQNELGAWKFEGQTNEVFIAGKKLYSMIMGDGKYKTASKGVRLTHEDIKAICRGDIVTWKSPAPNFKMNGEQKYTVRRIKKRC